MSPEALIYLLAGFIAAWGISLVVRTRATRRVARGRCAECARLWDDDEQRTCPSCRGDRVRQRGAALKRPAFWGMLGIVIAPVGVACPVWAKFVLYALTQQHLQTDIGTVGATGLILATLAGVWLIRELHGDPSGGRARCRRCWYPMQDEAPATCPECGTRAARLGELHRTRRRAGPIVLAALLLAVAQIGWLDARIQRYGVVGLVPTQVLIAGIGIVPDAWVVRDPNRGNRGNMLLYNRDRSLATRVANGELSEEQLARVRRAAVRRIRGSTAFEVRAAYYELVAATDRLSRGGGRAPTYISGARYFQTPSGFASRSLDRGPRLDSPPTPELDLAAAAFVRLAVTDLRSESRDVSGLETMWLLDRVSEAATDSYRQGIASQQVLDEIVAAESDLRALVAGEDARNQATALLLLAMAGLSKPGDLDLLEPLATNADPEVCLPAGAAIGSIALSDPDSVGALGSFQMAEPWSMGAQRVSLWNEPDLARAMFDRGLATGSMFSPELIGSHASRDPTMVDAALDELMRNPGSGTWPQFLSGVPSEVLGSRTDALCRLLATDSSVINLYVAYSVFAGRHPEDLDLDPKVLDALERLVEHYTMQVESPRRLTETYRGLFRALAPERNRSLYEPGEEP
ncbi:MAG: zinc ribbon domain-containing protein [Phycisphaerales bacterium]